MQPKTERERCLAFNEELRKDRQPFALPDHSGHVAFMMDELDYWYHVKFTDPELGASDPAVCKPAWRKFLRSEVGRKYLINPHEGKATPLDARVAHRIIVR